VTTGTAGVDLGGTKIQTVIVRNRKVAGSARVSTPQTGAEDVVAAIAATVREAAEEAAVAVKDLVAVGIGSPGRIDRETGIVSGSPNVNGFADPVPFGPMIAEALNVSKVTVDNDVRVATLGELKRGAGRGRRNFLGVFVGTGVGGGLVLEGRLREGRGAAGEVGHMVARHGGRRCGCGRRGCLEAYAGRRSMETTARRWAERGKKTALFAIQKEKHRPSLTSGVFAAALERKDAVATRLIDEAVWALGTVLASVQNLLDLEAIIVGGGLGDRLGPPFVARIEREMQPHLFVPDRPPELLTTELGDLGGAVGAAVRAGG
jgi:glucokinase